MAVHLHSSFHCPKDFDTHSLTYTAHGFFDFGCVRVFIEAWMVSTREVAIVAVGTCKVGFGGTLL